ncbi:MAG: glycosyltransferase [Burkholderiales bacterium]|nr:MAG: glycosyltransferase [Burkholderiales bacterium]
MKLFSSSSKRSGGQSHGFDLQATPVRIDPEITGASAQIKVDLAVMTGNMLLVAGWRTRPVEVSLQQDGQTVGTREIEIDRPDVNAHFQLSTDQRCGFVLIAESVAEDDRMPAVSLAWTGSDNKRYLSKSLSIQPDSALSASEQAVLGPALLLLSSQLPLNSAEWKQLIAKSPPADGTCHGARGHLEGAAVCDQTRDAVVVGWVVQAPGTRVWLEDQTGHAYSLEGAFRRFRQDVHDAVGNDFGHGSRDAGFLLHIKGLKAGARLKLRAVAETGLHVLSETACSALPVDPVAAARWLFAVGTPLSELKQRIAMVDQPVLTPLIDYRQSIWDELPVQRRNLGAPPQTPQASIIVPLYGRIDFVEHQMLEFAKDKWLQQNAEIIYVLDDPRLVESFNALAETLHRLYRLPFRWLWGSVNRGFSGANNLGALHAKGEHLVFLNSDAFPRRPGWVQDMLQALDQHPELGAVGARLLFGDGGIQHAGMEFQRREELGIWVNHHPRMGLDPSLDPHQGLTIVPAVTGACMALRRADFERIGGWDTGYLIGDFEDSDLCLKLRAEGMHIGYLPQVELTHLERQSFKLLGQDEFRQRVVIYNAVRHQSRWESLIEQRVDSPPVLA